MVIFLVSGCATSPPPAQIQDPFEVFNRSMFQFNEGIDRYVSKPVAKTYAVIPEFLRQRITYFFGNIDDVVTVLNDLLQFKLEQGLADSMRVVTNSSVGLAGLFDVAEEWGMPKHNERFADTLGVWGLASGPYLVLPLWGPSSLRDAPALLGDIYAYPLAYLYPVAVRNSLQGLKMVDNRARLLSASDIADEVSVDKYSFTRDTYYQWRLNQIYDDNPPVPDVPPEAFDFQDMQQ